MKRIASVVGCRPNFIKLAMMDRALRSHKGIKHIIVHTGQHYDYEMSESFFDQLQLPPSDINCGISGQSAIGLIGLQTEALGRALKRLDPDIVIVYGDTAAAAAGAIATKGLGMQLAHVEAGLRVGTYTKGLIEEECRVIADNLSDWLFCPTEVAVRNIKHLHNKWSGLHTHIENVGCLMYDAYLHFVRTIDQGPPSKILSSLPRENRVVVTLHRASLMSKENVQEVEYVLNQLDQLVYEGYNVVWPVHPRSEKIITDHKRWKQRTAITLIPPVQYLEMLRLINSSCLVITDSGGVQKEAFFMRRKCIVVREQTEWEELVSHNVCELWQRDCGTELFEVANDLSEREIVFPVGLYGDGNAAVRIASCLA